MKRIVNLFGVIYCVAVIRVFGKEQAMAVFCVFGKIAPKYVVAVLDALAGLGKFAVHEIVSRECWSRHGFH